MKSVMQIRRDAPSFEKYNITEIAEEYADQINRLTEEVLSKYAVAKDQLITVLKMPSKLLDQYKNKIDDIDFFVKNADAVEAFDMLDEFPDVGDQIDEIKLMQELVKNNSDISKESITRKIRNATTDGDTEKGFMKVCLEGLGCFVKDTPVAISGKQFRNIPAAYALAAVPLVAPIQNIQADDIIIAHKHEVSYYATADNGDDLYIPGWQDYDYLDITPETWQIGSFIIEEEDGSVVEIEANRPKKWFEDYQLNQKGDKAFIVIEEMGISDYAMLQSIRPTIIDTRNYALNECGKVDRPVITTYKRIANEISDYTFSNGQVISCTPNHPFFSSDRQAYIPVGELSFGETVQTTGEREVKFIGGKAREKGEHVYNFEVWREHNYYVGFEGSEDFVLVHNSCFNLVKNFLKKEGKLPDNYLTKQQAKDLGWVPSQGNLDEVAPGKWIGGDTFGNYEGKLPSASGRTWKEADINYQGGFRGPERLLYSSDGLFYKTTDHYQTFTKLD